MEKLELITNIDIWIEMRNIRNRIVHDYLPDKMAEMYQLVCTEFYTELNALHQKIQKLAE